MSTLSAFKSSIKAALNVPHGRKARSRRQVISFNEALEDMKSSQTGFVTCAAFHPFGRCRKEIPLLDSNFLANLDQFDLTDVQAPIKLMPLMLCSTHWGKTVYHNALFLDWLSVYGSKQDHPQFESTVVDYESAIVIDSNESSGSTIAISSRSTPDGKGRPVSAPDSSNRDQNYLETLTRVAQVQMNSDYETPTLPETEPLGAAQKLPEISVLVGMESYASIELGVANLEIMYQETLKCIAMTSDGWRCPTVIHKEQQLQARELLSHHATAEAELDIEPIPKLVLCPGHATGELPRMYAEKWAVFSKQRLSKEEAMSKFNADSWISVQFFSNEKMDDDTLRTTSSSRSRSASHLSSRSRDKYDFGSTQRAGGNSRKPQVTSPSESPAQKVEFSYSNTSSIFKFETTLGPRDVIERTSSSDNPVNCVRNEHQPQSAPEPVCINAQPAEESPGSEPVASSASQEVVKATISLERKNITSQDSRLEIPAVLPSSHGAMRQNHRFESQDIIDKTLIKAMQAPFLTGGYVYVFRSPTRQLCKVARATNTNVNIRGLQMIADCQLQDFDQVAMTSDYTPFPERVTNLVHLELQNFRAKLSCEGHHRSPWV